MTCPAQRTDSIDMVPRKLTVDYVCRFARAVAIGTCNWMRVPIGDTLRDDAVSVAVVSALETLKRFDPARATADGNEVRLFCRFARQRIAKDVERAVWESWGGGTFRTSTIARELVMRVQTVADVRVFGLSAGGAGAGADGATDDDGEPERVWPVTRPDAWRGCRLTRIVRLHQTAGCQSWGVRGEDSFGLWFWCAFAAIVYDRGEFSPQSWKEEYRRRRAKRKRDSVGGGSPGATA